MRTNKEIIEAGKIWNYIPGIGGMIKLPDSGTASIVWGRNEDGYEHVSVAPRKETNTPTWNDMAFIKEICFYDNEEAYQIMPKAGEYINIIQNCLHIWRPKNGRELKELVKE